MRSVSPFTTTYTCSLVYLHKPLRRKDLQKSGRIKSDVTPYIVKTYSKQKKIISKYLHMIGTKRSRFPGSDIRLPIAVYCYDSHRIRFRIRLA